jgi:hypothetical protein
MNMVVMAASADLIIPNNRQFICYQVFDNGPYLRPNGIVIDINARLPEAHERPHAYASDNQGIHTVLCQKVYRNHASPLDMALVGQGGNTLNFPVLQRPPG